VSCFCNQDDNQCPWQAFLDNLKQELAKWIKDGEQVVVMLNTNSNVPDGTVNQMFLDIGMGEVLSAFNSELAATAAFSCNHQDAPMDGIFTTSTVQLQGGGHFAFSDGPGKDHCSLWFDKSCQIAFGHSPPPMKISKAQRLTCTDPHVR
jgi:hypothetical protein